MPSNNPVFHEATSIFPLITGPEFAGLFADIQQHGQREPILLHKDGRILDGRNRFKVCKQLGIEPKFRTWDGPGSALELVLSLNLHRRHLSPSQRATLAVELLPRFSAEARNRQRGGRGGKLLPPNLEEAGESIEKVGTLVQVSHGYAAFAKTLKEQHPDLYRRVGVGEIELSDARREIQFDERDRVIRANQELVRGTRPLPLDTKYQSIVVDPPWDYKAAGLQNSGPEPPYAKMSLDEIAALPVKDMAAEESHLYLWTTGLFLPYSFALLEGWGFRYKGTLTWIKSNSVFTTHFHSTTEFVLFGVKGSMRLLRGGVPSHFSGDRPRRHSSKPDSFYELVESCSPGPWMEMFARRSRPGWTSWGAEVENAS